MTPRASANLIAYGNGASTVYHYDPLTFRLTSLYTARPAASFPGDDPNPPNPPRGVQNLGYTYDPVGNITTIRDNAQQTIYFSNQIVRRQWLHLRRDLPADTSDRPRGHRPGGASRRPPTTTAPRMNQPLPNDRQALQNYTESYQYDQVGNFLALLHATPSGNWSRTYAYDEPNVAADATIG